MSDAPTFERARRPEHKEQRRLAIIQAAITAATEQGVRNVTLGDIAGAAGMAKSNVLRYFGTREEIYLEVCADEVERWVVALRASIAEQQPAGPQAAAHLLATSLEDRALLCDLLSQSSASLEHNVRPERGRDFKLVLFSELANVGLALADTMPEIQGEKIFELGMVVYLAITAVWPTCNAPAEIMDLLDPRILELVPPTFSGRLERALHTFFVGLIAI